MIIPPHEIPTHLDAPDRAFAGLTVRQLLMLAIGAGGGFMVADKLGLPLGLLPALLLFGGGMASAFIQPYGRPFEEWVFVLLRYVAAPRIATWRPDPARVAGAVALREVIIPSGDEEEST